MHPRALYVLGLALIAVLRVDCDDKTKWYSGLRSMLKNCPSKSWNNSGQDEFLESFRRCVQQRAIDTLDTLLNNDVISVLDGVNLIRLSSNNENNMEYQDNSSNVLDGDTSWSAIIWNRLIRVLRSHAFKIDVDHVFNTTTNMSGSDLNSNIVEGRRRRRRRYHMMPFMMLGLLLMGSIFIPMGFQFLAVLGGKALILAKMALILSSIQGLKKIATNGVNYGLYHSPISESWHDRSHQVFPEEEAPYPVYMPSHS